MSGAELACDFEAFAKVVRTRRSVRAYAPEPIPDSILDACFDLALLAPTSHNLETWQFLDVRSPEKLALPRAARVVMVIAAGRRAEGGVMPQFRFDASHYIQRV